MGLDIRMPIGLMFAILGLLLAGFGLVGDKAIYQRSLGVNINLWWGLVLLAFGVVMLLLGRRGTSAMRTTETSHEGQMIEELERRTGREGEPSRGGH
jgi:membrane protein implicated in regulation of membrane protease activity